MYFPKREEKTFTLPKYKEKSIDNESRYFKIFERGSRKKTHYF